MVRVKLNGNDWIERIAEEGQREILVGWKRDFTDMTLFKIIPDRSINNQQNRKFWRLVHEILELDHRSRNRRVRDGLAIRYRLRDMVWVDMVARCTKIESEGKDGEPVTDLKRTIEFFICVPTKFASTIKQKLIDRHPQITLETVDLYTNDVPESADVWEYRYQRHDIFSLRANDNEQTSPLSSIMHAVYDMQDGDFMRLSVGVERVDRRKWYKTASYAWKQLDQKRVPSRVRLDPSRAVTGIGDILKHAGDFVLGIVDDALEAVQGAFFKSDKGFVGVRKKNATQGEYDRLMMDGEITTDTHKKISEPTFQTRIRLAVDSADRSRRQMIQYSVSNAFAELNGNNKLQAHKVRVNIRGKVIEEMNNYQPMTKDHDANVMSAKELGKIHQLPTAELQTKFADALESKRKVETDIPKPFRDPNGIHVGTADVRGEKIDIFIPVPANPSPSEIDELMMSRVFIGSPRMGKDTAIINFVVEAAKKGWGSVVLDVIDEKGNLRGMCDSIRDALPPDRIIDLNMADINYPIYMGLNEVVSRSENAGNRLAGDLATIFEIEDNGRTRTYLREAVKAVNGDLLGVRLLLLSDGAEGDFLHETIERLKKEGKDYLAMFWEAYKAESRGQKSEIRKPILNRLDEIFGDDHLKNMFGQESNPDIDFAKWLKEGKVILIRVPNRHPDLNELSVKTLAQWTVLKTFYTKLVMNDPDCLSWLVINEPHQFMTDGLIRTLGRMLRECPKHRLSMLFAIHDFSPATIPSKLVDALFSASLNWHILKNTNLSVYEKLAEYIQPTYTPQEAMRQTEKGQTITAFFYNGSYQTPFLMKNLAPVNKRNKPNDNAFLTIRHSQMYGRPKRDVEMSIFEKERQLFNIPRRQKTSGA